MSKDSSIQTIERRHMYLRDFNLCDSTECWVVNEFAVQMHSILVTLH